MKNVAAAVSFVAIPLGFASLASLWSYITEEETEESNIDSAITALRSPHRVNFLFKTLETAAVILKLGRKHVYKNMTRANADAFFNYLDELERKCVDHTDTEESTVIVIEGLPGSGVSTLVNNLVTYTRASRGAGIGPQLAHFEIILSKVPPALGYAFQVVSNYAKALESEEMSRGVEQFVIVERMYHSTCALTVCAEVDPSAEIAALPSSAFHWPLDLPQPAMVSTLPMHPCIRDVSNVVCWRFPHQTITC
jgi:hypothetical protein